MIVLTFFFCISGCFFFFFFFFYPTITYLSLAISFLFLRPSNYIIAIIITIMLINTTVTDIFEKSSWGEFKAKNSNGIVYPYSLR